MLTRPAVHSPSDRRAGPDHGSMTVPGYAEALGSRLRTARQRRGLTRADVERRSDGRWKVSSLSAYERGLRSLKVQHLAELAELYQVPVTSLLPELELGDGSRPAQIPPIVLNLDRLRKLPPTRTGPLRRWIAMTPGRRSEDDRHTLAIRRSDLPVLAKIYNTTPTGLLERLDAWGVLT